MKTEQIKTQTEHGPWATIAEHQVKQVRTAVEGITGMATHYKTSTECDETVPVDELIDALSSLAGYAHTSLLLLNPTNSNQNCEPGSLAGITSQQAVHIRELLKNVHELSVDGLKKAKSNTKISSVDFIGHFSMIKKHGMELEGNFDEGDEEDTA